MIASNEDLAKLSRTEGRSSAGIIADLFGMAWAIGAIGALTFLSGAIVFVAIEGRPGARQ
jgi:hypothetical protein